MSEAQDSSTSNIQHMLHKCKIKCRSSKITGEEERQCTPGSLLPSPSSNPELHSPGGELKGFPGSLGAWLRPLLPPTSWAAVPYSPKSRRALMCLCLLASVIYIREWDRNHPGIVFHFLPRPPREISQVLHACAQGQAF